MKYFTKTVTAQYSISAIDGFYLILNEVCRTIRFVNVRPHSMALIDRSAILGKNLNGTML